MKPLWATVDNACQICRFLAIREGSPDPYAGQSESAAVEGDVSNVTDYKAHADKHEKGQRQD